MFIIHHQLPDFYDQVYSLLYKEKSIIFTYQTLYDKYLKNFAKRRKMAG